jgi:uncharacterized membrane protein YbhN (UPF0104 family)
MLTRREHTDDRTLRPRLASRIVVAVVLMAAIVSLILAVPPLRGAARQIGHMRPGWVAAAIALEVASCASFVVIFRLFFDRLPGGLARELGWVETGSGALLPGGGVGGLAVGGWLLREAGLSTREIVKRSSGLFFLTSAASVAALAGAGLLLVTGAAPGPRDFPRAGAPVCAGLAAIVAALVAPAVWRRLRRRNRLSTVGDDLVAGIGGATRALSRPSWRLLGAAGYLGLDIAALAAAFAAAGRPLAVAPLVLGYTVGYLANLIPAPGGFGALEGGLAAALIAYGAPPTQTAAAVIVYHAIAFWIPSLGGLLTYWRLRRRLRSGQEARAIVSHGGVVAELCQQAHVAVRPDQDQPACVADAVAL